MPRKFPFPDASQGFLQRICNAIEIDPKDLAKRLDLKYKTDIEPFLHLPASQLAIELDDTFDTIYQHVSERVAMLLAVKFELDKQLQKERERRLQRRDYVKGQRK